MRIHVYCMTNRLVIRSFRQGDVVPYWAIVRDARVVRFFAGGRPQCFWEASAYVQDCIARDRANGITRYAVALRETRAFIGFTGFKRIGDEIDFGYRFARRTWRLGIATEAGARILRYGREHLFIGSVQARVARDNDASALVLFKLGFVVRGPPRAAPGGHSLFTLDHASRGGQRPRVYLHNRL